MSAITCGVITEKDPKDQGQVKKIDVAMPFIDRVEAQYFDSILRSIKFFVVRLEQEKTKLEALLARYEEIKKLTSGFDQLTVIDNEAVVLLEETCRELSKLARDLTYSGRVLDMSSELSKLLKFLDDKPTDTKEIKQIKESFALAIGIAPKSFKCIELNMAVLCNKAIDAAVEAADIHNKWQEEVEKHDRGLTKYKLLIEVLQKTGITTKDGHNRELFRKMAQGLVVIYKEDHNVPKCSCIKCRQSIRKWIERVLFVPDVFIYVELKLRPEFIAWIRKLVNAILAEF